MLLPSRPNRSTRFGAGHVVRSAGTVLSTLALAGTLAACASPASAPTDSSDGSVSDSGSGAATGKYRDGTYSAEGEYLSPGGAESIAVELTLESGIVTAVTVSSVVASADNSFFGRDGKATGGERYQKEFSEGIAAIVVGKNIDELDVTRVAGSSLTSGGFNDALETIKADALG